LRKRIWSTLIAVAVLSVVLVVAVLGKGTSGSSIEVNPAASSSDVVIVAPAPHYLTAPPFFLNNTHKTTQIYLEAANASYGLSESDFDPDVHFTVSDNATILVVKGTIRSDYTTQEIIEFSHEGVTSCVVGLDIYLHDAQGNFVNTLNRGNPFRGCIEISLGGGEESNFEVAFAVPLQNVLNVTSFAVYVSYLDPFSIY
jgi:hypothetical protein